MSQELYDVVLLYLKELEKKNLIQWCFLIIDLLTALILLQNLNQNENQYFMCF